jgi:hypothetical protein
VGWLVGAAYGVSRIPGLRVAHEVSGVRGMGGVVLWGAVRACDIAGGLSRRRVFARGCAGGAVDWGRLFTPDRVAHEVPGIPSITPFPV